MRKKERPSRSESNPVRYIKQARVLPIHQRLFSELRRKSKGGDMGEKKFKIF